jgi:hypothetical protein
MGVDWAAGSFRRKPHVRRDGTVCSLSHVHPFRFELAYEAMAGQAARVVTVNVGFSSHVFTRRPDHAEPDPELYSDNRETRVFDMERYERSKLLRTIVMGLERRKCFFANRDNFVTLELNGSPPGHEYQVFFAVRRASSRAVEMIVQSAYLGRIEEAPAGERKKQIRFKVIVSKALSNQSLVQAR